MSWSATVRGTVGPSIGKVLWSGDITDQAGAELFEASGGPMAPGGSTSEGAPDATARIDLKRFTVGAPAGLHVMWGVVSPGPLLDYLGAWRVPASAPAASAPSAPSGSPSSAPSAGGVPSYRPAGLGAGWWLVLGVAGVGAWWWFRHR